MDQLQNFEINFIKTGIDDELDKKTRTLLDSEMKLRAIANYFSSLIEGKEKKAAEYIKIHETEKNNFSLVLTSRRGKLLQDAFPVVPTEVSLVYDTTTNKQFDFIVSKQQFSFEKQSAANHFIIDDQIGALCKNISSIKVSMKELITTVYNKFVGNFEQYQTKLESIVKMITLVDVMYTKSAIAKKYKYCKPNIVQSDKSFVDAKNMRHCLI